MSNGRFSLRSPSNLAILLGALLLLIFGGRLVWGELQGRRLRENLQQPATNQPQPLATPSMPSAASPIPPTELPGTSTPAAGAQPTATLGLASTPAPAAPPVRLVFADLGIDVPVEETTWQAVETANGLESEWVVPEYAAGHHVNSALLGGAGNVVISGHNNIFGRVFEPISLAWEDEGRERIDAGTDRSRLLDGRIIQLYDAGGTRYDYVVTGFYRLRDTGVSLEQRIANARYMEQTDEQLLTLVTCWPVTSNTFRLIVRAEPVD